MDPRECLFQSLGDGSDGLGLSSAAQSEVEESFAVIRQPGSSCAEEADRCDWDVPK